MRSSSFVLGGSGYISVKMGGNAAVTKVFLSDGTQIGYYRNFRFRDVSFPYIAQGGAWCDMAAYVIDLSEYLGKELYLELHDEVITDGWANAFFDDVITYYETAPDISQRYDKVPDGHNPGEMARLAEIPWVMVPKVSTEAPRQIPNGDFETGDLTGWTIYGSGFPIRNGLPAANSDETYWDQELPYNKSGSYFMNGWSLSGNEANTWRIRSTPFTLEGSGWISVKMGGHAAAVRVYRLDGTLVGDFDQSRFYDREFPYLSKGGSWCDMATYFLDLTPNTGEVLYIELCDVPIQGGWANAFFDEVITYYETAPDWEHKSDAVNNSSGQEPATVSIPWQLAAKQAGTEEPDPIPGGVQMPSGGLETGDLTGGTVLTGGFNADKAVISAQTYWGENLPYNQAGDYHLNGWNTGIDEPGSWSVRSSTFTLAGSGYISVRMGGHAAAVKVFTADGTLVGYYRQTRFKDTGFPSVAIGSWADMGTYVMDLSAYLGQELYIELHDEPVDSWAHAFFDEVVTYYETAPDWEHMSDTVANSAGASPSTVHIPWQLAENLNENAVLERSIPENAQIPNGGFEAGGLEGWEVLTDELDADIAVISA